MGGGLRCGLTLDDRRTIRSIVPFHARFKMISIYETQSDADHVTPHSTTRLTMTTSYPSMINAALNAMLQNTAFL